MAPLQTARGEEVLMTDGSHIFAVNGGNTVTGQGVPQGQTVEIYDVAANSWSYGNPTVLTSVASGGGLAGGRLVVYGGSSGGGYLSLTQVATLNSPCITGTPPSATSTRTTGPTRTVTPTRATATGTPTLTPSPAPQACGIYSDYGISQTLGATIVPGTTNIGLHGYELTTTITLPFPFQLYGRSFTSAVVSTSGNLQFTSDNPTAVDLCLPAQNFGNTIFGHWGRLQTYLDENGIFTSISGSAPNRVFNVEWRADRISDAQLVNFEIRLYEGQSRFDIIYGPVDGNGEQASVGVQRESDPNGLHTQFSCEQSILYQGLMLSFTQPVCNSPTITATPTATLTPTATATATRLVTGTPPTPSATVVQTSATVAATGSVTSVATATGVATGIAPTPSATTAATIATPTGSIVTPATTPTECTISYTDVPVGSTFYAYVRCLACRGIISGYPDGTFKPNNNVTRGQLSKIVSNAAGFQDPQTTQLFQDVGVNSTFFVYIGRLASLGYINGYPCGGPGEVCVPPANLPYFRPGAPATRGQISKIVSNAAGYNDPPGGQRFQDVPPGSTYYTYTFRLTARGVMSGYPCGAAPAGQCVPPANLPYFLPAYNATRGQTSKITSNTFFPDCNNP